MEGRDTVCGQALPEGSTLRYAVYGKDGTLYVIYRDSDYKSHLCKIAEGNRAEELSADNRDLESAMLYGLYVRDDGAILIPAKDQVLVLDASGAVKNKLPQTFPMSQYCDSYTLTAGSFLTVGDRGFLRYNAENWNEEETIPFQNDETDIYGSLTSAAQTGDDFYLANTKGIHHMAAQGTMWETVVDGSLNTLGMPSTAIRRLFVGNDHDFYVWYDVSEDSKLLHYTYDPDMPSVPSKTITVYGLDLSGNQSIKQAASLFQMENPDIRIELIEGAGGSGGTSKSDTIRALNAELLNGNGADVLVLDGLPADSYIEKGILDDLSDMLTPMVETGDLYPNIAESFTQADGSIYQYPARVVLPVIFGDSAVIDGAAALATLKGWQEKNPDKAVFPKTVYENVLRQMVALYYPELKSGKAGQLDTEKIRLLLETTKAVGDASGCKAVFDKSEDDGSTKIGSMQGVPDLGAGTYTLLEGKTAAAVERLKGMQYIMIPDAVAKETGYPLRQFHDIYYPNGLLGVVKSGREKETARKFVEFALSLKVQESDLSDGFPVSKKAEEAWRERTFQGDFSIALDTGMTISAEYPDEQRRSEVMGMLDNLHTPVTVDDILLEMMISETKGYFEGTQTAAEAAKQFENKAKLYYAQ